MFMTHFENYENYKNVLTVSFDESELINNDFIYFIYCLKFKRYKRLGILIETFNSQFKAFYFRPMYTRIRNLMRAFMKIRRFVRLNYKTNYTNVVIINENSLELTALEEDCLKLNINGGIYSFNFKDLIKLYKYSLYAITDYFYLNDELSSIKNPYTNIPFTLKENILIYEFIKKYYFKIKKTIPDFINNYKKCYFNPRIFSVTFKQELLNKSIHAFLIKLNKSEIKAEFLNLISSSLFIRERYCSFCFKRIQIEKDFLDVLKIYILNSNGVYKYGFYEQKFITRCRLLDIKLEKYHYKTHRRAVKGRQNRRRNNIALHLNNHPLNF